MSRLGPDSKLVEGLGAFSDAVIVNLLLVVASLPVVTAGAAWTAAHGTLLEAAREEGSRPAATFLRYLRATWAPATLVWMVVLALGAFLVWEYRVLGGWEGIGAVVAQALTVTGMLCLGLWGVWVFPLLSQGHSLGRAARLGALLAFQRLRRTAVCLMILVLPGVVAFAMPSAIGVLAFLMLVVGWSLVAYLNDLLLVDVLPAAR